MTTTILSIVCIVLVALCLFLCLFLWVYAGMANKDLIDAQWETERVKWEAQYFERQTQKYSDMCLQLKRGPNL